MAINKYALTADTDFRDGTNFITASVTPTANRLQLFAVTVASTNAGTPVSPTVTGCGLTWVEVGGVNFWNTWGWGRTVVFRAMGSSPSSGQISIVNPSSMATCNWSLNEFDGIDTTGINGANAILQYATASATTTNSISTTLGSFSGPLNATFGAIGASGLAGSPGTITFTAGSGFTALDNVGQEWCNTGTEWKASNSTTVNATASATADFIGIVGIEIKATPTITGNSITSAVGTEGVGLSKAQTGTSATTGIGNVVYVPASIFPITTVAATGSVGTLVPGIQAFASGVNATGNLGNLVYSASQQHGVTGSGQAGVLGINITFPSTGISAGSAIGNAGVVGQNIYPLSGVVTAGAAGTILVQPVVHPAHGGAPKFKKRPTKIDLGLVWTLKVVGNHDAYLSGRIKKIFPKISDENLDHAIMNIMTDMNNFFAHNQELQSQQLVDQRESDLIRFYALQAMKQFNANIIIDETPYRPGLLH